MSLEEDLKVIKGRLTGDKKKDIDTLFLAVDEFSLRPYSKQLDFKITNMLTDIIKNCDPKTAGYLSRYIQSRSTEKYNKNLMLAKAFIDKKNYDKALSIISDLESQVNASFKEAQAVSNSDTTFRYCFSAMQYAIAQTLFPAKNVVELPFDYVSLLTLKGQAYYFLGKKEKSQNALKEAAEYDPVSPDLCFLQADMDMFNENWISFTMDIDKAHRFLYNPEDFYRYYLYVAAYYRNYKNDMINATLIMKAFSKPAEKPINTLTKMPDKTKQFLLSNEIPLDLDQDVLNIAIQQAHLAYNDKDIPAYKYFYNILLNYRTPAELDLLLSPNKPLVKLAK